jgi:hypothetical protein
LALKSVGTVVAWGQYEFQPATVPAGLGGVIAIAAGADHTVALRSDGTVVAWGGENDFGQTIVPAGLGGVIAVSAGGYHTAALKINYDFVGFFAPVDAPPTVNLLKAGAAVPVKFSLGGDQGLAIFASGFPTSHPIACNSSGFFDSVEQTVAAGGSGLSYDALTDTYTYVWKTDRAWAGQCRQLMLRFADGTEHPALFRFSK